MNWSMTICKSMCTQKGGTIYIPSGGFVVIILTCAVEEISATKSGEENGTTSVNNFDT